MRFTTKPKNIYSTMRKAVKEGQTLIVPMDNRLLEDAKPYVASAKTLPSWFKISPKDGIRKCAGVQDYLNLGYIIPAWSDFSFNPRPDLGGWEVEIGQMPFSLVPFESQPFPMSTTGACPMTHHRKQEESPYPKLVNPYSFVTAKGWSSIISGIPYEPNNNYDVVPAIVHTDYYHHMNVVLNLKGDEPFVIRYGTPLAHVIPFKRSGDIQEIKFADEEYFKYVFARGMSDGPTNSLDGSVGQRYRKNRKNSDD
jgi:hypothetical protein